MANHKSAEKRIRQSAKRHERNSYLHKSTRTAIKDLRATTDKEEAKSKLSKVSSMLDNLAQKHIIHKNKASNLKSGLAKKINALA